MLKNYLKITLRNLLKNKAYSLINILGFAFSISVCLMIVLYLMKEYSFDSYHTNADFIYRLTDSEKKYSSIDYRVKDIIKNNFTDVRNACLVQNFFEPTEININNNAHYINNLMSTDNNFFKMFSVTFINGNSSKPFQNINSVILTESAAKTLFPNEHPIGKEIILWHINHVIVSAVIKDFPDNTSINANIIVNAENKDFRFRFSCEDCNDPSTHRYPFNIYLQLHEKSDPISLINIINSHNDLLVPYEKGINLLSLKNMYLEDETSGADALRGNPKLLNLFASIAFIILVLALINYVNLTVSRQSKRNKETGIRKTIGADRKAMVLLFITESILVTFIAFVIAIIILEFSLPFFNNIVESSLTAVPLIYFPANLILILSVLLIGILSGTGPAFVLSSFNPIRMLNGNFITKKKSFFAM